MVRKENEQSKDIIMDTFLNDENATPDETLLYFMENTKGFKIKELVDFWYSYGHTTYVYLVVKKPMGSKDLAPLSLVIGSMFVESLIEAYEIRKED